MISQEIQKLLDRAKQNSSLVNSVDLGLRALQRQVADLQASISMVKVGSVFSDEDQAALAEATSNLDTSIAMLQKDIPANTQADPTTGNQPITGGPGTVQNNETQGSGQQSSENVDPALGAPVGDPSAPAPDLSNDSGHKAEADAASQAKPIAGTGQVGPA